MYPTSIWPFFVGGRPVAVHQIGEAPGAEGYYGSLQPEAFLYWVVTEAESARNADQLDGAPVFEVGEKAAKHLAAIRFRMFYLNLLETFFAQFFANVQAPRHPSAWLTLYSSRVLSKLVRRLLESPWSSDATTTVLSRPTAFASWLFAVERMADLSQPERSLETTAVLGIIERLAREYAEDGISQEYNAIKHGARAASASWTLRISETGRPEVGASVNSGNGTHFPVLHGFGHSQYAWRTRSHGWDLERDIDAAMVVAKLLFNLVQVRRNPDPGEPTPFFTFRKLDIPATFNPRSSAGHFEIGHPPLGDEGHWSEADLRKAASEDQLAFERWLFRVPKGE